MSCIRILNRGEVFAMGWKNCRPKSGAENELRKIAGPEPRILIDVVRSPLPMLLCSRDGRAPIQAAKVRRKPRQAAQRRVEEPHRAAQRAALGVVIRGGQLDQPLIELDELAVRFEPELLP